jgi:hypothetical protein
MPGKRASLFPLLLPAVVCVPLAAVILFVLVGVWHGMDARAFSDARRADAVLRAETSLENAVSEQMTVTGLLSRSPLVWLWVKFQGQRLTASNRSHAENALAEIGNYARMVPGLTVYLASATTGLLYRDGAPVRTLRQADPQDAWYFAALRTDALLTVVEGGNVRTSARIMNGADLLGVISCVRDASAIGKEIFPPPLTQRGLTAALLDPQGQVLAATAPGGTVARTAAALLPGVRADAIQAALRAVADPNGADALETLEGRSQGSLLGVTLVHAAPMEGAILVALPVAADLSWARILALIIVPAACLGLILGSLATLARRRMGRVASLLQHQEQAEESARRAFTRIDASARSAQSAAENLRALAVTIGTEASAGVASSAGAAEAFARDEERDAEIRSGIAGRLTLMDELTASIDAALQRSRATTAAAQAVGGHAAKAGEELSRVITLGAAAAGAVDKAARGAQSLVEESGRLNLIAMNAAMEAARAGASGQRLSRMAEEVKGFADDASTRAKQLSASLAEAGEGLAGVSRAAQTAGQAVHETGAAAAAAPGAVTAWDDTAAVLARAQAAGVSAARLRDQAARSDRGRSVLEGIGKIIGRIRGLAGQAADLAGSVASDTESVALTAAAVMKEKKRHD